MNMDVMRTRNFCEIHGFIVNMMPERHAECVAAMESFMHSSALDFFSSDHYFTTLADGLGFSRKEVQT